MIRVLRRGVLIGAGLFALWRAARVARIAMSALVHHQPQRIGNWFRSPATTYERIYRNGFVYEAERARAEEEGWRIEYEDRTKPGRIEVVYERVTPPFGAEPPFAE